MKLKKYLAMLLTVILLLAALTGCGAKMEAPMSPNGDMYYGSAEDNAMGYIENENSSVVVGGTGLPENQKWVRTLHLNAETEDLDSLLTAVDLQVAQLQGYVEYRDVYHGGSYSNYGNRNASLTVRIPVELVDEFTAKVSGVSNVTSSSENLENITLTYVATESRILALETEQTRLLELLAKAENMSDLLEIEARLTDVRYELENYTTQLRKYDNQVDYATIHLNLREVQTLTPQAKDGIWKRISSGFMENLRGLGTFLENFLVWFLASLPWLIPLGGIVTGVILLIRRRRRKKNNMKADPQVPQE